MNKKRIAIAQIWQEQNSFSPIKTDFEDFVSCGYYTGEKILKKFEGINELGGFIKAADEFGVELVPLIRVMAWPKGNVRYKVYQKIKAEFLTLLKKFAPYDGILLSLHGSMVADKIFDVEGDILTSVNKQLLWETPIAVTLDLHANITKKMFDNSIFIRGYHTCPHVDLLETGYRTAKIFFNFMGSGIALNKWFIKIPMITPARGHNTKYGPLMELFNLIRKIELKDDVISASLFPVQPWVDLPELGWSVVVYTTSNENKAKKYAEEIAEYAWKLRERFFVDEIKPESAIKEAKNMKKGLMVISDSDSTGSGGTGDNTCILSELIKQKVNFPSLLTIVDKEVVHQALETGIGGDINCSIGGKLDKKFSKPVKIKGKVLNITDGKFFIEGHLGKNYINMGTSVVLEVGTIKILVSERSAPVIEQNIYNHAGLNPRDFRVVVVKSPVGFRDAYESIADKIVLADCPGLSSSNLDLFTFKNIPHPLYPFDKHNTWLK